MDLSGINDKISLLIDIVAVASILLILIVFFTDKKLSSMSIVLVVFCIGEGMSSILMPHLKTLANQTAAYGYGAWYLGWILQYLIWLYLLLKLHQHLKIYLSNMALLIAWYYSVSIILNAVDYIDRLTVDSGFFAQFYQISNLTMNLFVIPVVGLVYWHDLYKRRALNKMQEA